MQNKILKKALRKAKEKRDSFIKPPSKDQQRRGGVKLDKNTLEATKNNNELVSSALDVNPTLRHLSNNNHSRKASKNFGGSNKRGGIQISHKIKL